MLSDEQRKSLELAAEMYARDVEVALPYLEVRGVGRDTALSAGLGYVTTPAIPEHNHARGRLAIPYITPAGVVGMTFRCIQDHNCREVDRHSKYVKPSGQVTTLYNVKDCHTSSLDIHIAEGELDTLTLSALCSLPAVGIAGAKNWQEWWKEVLSDFRRVFVFCDGDEAGRQLGNKIQKEVGRSVILIHLPDGEDVNSMYLKYGPEKLREMAK